MLTLEQARGLAAMSKKTGKATQIASTSNGKNRYAWFEEVEDGGKPAVTVRLHATTILTFREEGVEVRTGGWNTITTFEALNHSLQLSAAFYTKKWVPYYCGTRMSEGMVIGYDGRVISTTTNLTPERHH